AADDRKRRSQPVRDGAGFQFTELRTTDEEHHVHSNHPAAESIRRLELAHDVANHHADGICDAGERERREGDPEASRKTEHDCGESVQADGPEQYGSPTVDAA